MPTELTFCLMNQNFLYHLINSAPTDFMNLLAAA